MHHHIGPVQGVVGIAVTGLDFVFAPLAEARIFQHPLQDHLAPVAAFLAVALEGAGQIDRVPAHLLIQRFKAADLMLQQRAVFGLLVINVLDLFAEVAELFAQRV